MQTLKIDIVSDVSCPWCIIGYKALQVALQRIDDKVTASITWHPFELNPNMPKEGQDIELHLIEKYQIDKQQVAQNREAIEQRGLTVGYEFVTRGGGRIYNTFDAHRLLHWASSVGKQTELKLALFDLYFKQAGDPSNHNSLLTIIADLGMDVEQARKILSCQLYSEEVRAEQAKYQSLGISSVPAVIVNEKHLISGGQPADVFEQALLQISKESACSLST